MLRNAVNPLRCALLLRATPGHIMPARPFDACVSPCFARPRKQTQRATCDVRDYTRCGSLLCGIIAARPEHALCYVTHSGVMLPENTASVVHRRHFQSSDERSRAL
jgi:hypothetical protein